MEPVKKLGSPKHILSDANNNITSVSAKIPESPQDTVDFSDKNTTKKEKKSFLSKFGVDIAAFATGAVGIGAALKTGKFNKQLNEKAVLILESVGVKSSSLQSLSEKMHQLGEIITKDGLTGLINRLRLDKYLKDAFNNAKNNGAELHVVMFDIDRFKNVNTALGHDGGDAILKYFSESISKVTKKYEDQGVKVKIARYGGEEFTLIVEDAAKDKAKKIAEEIRVSLNQNKALEGHANKFVEYYKNAEAKLMKKRDEKGLAPSEEALLEDYKYLHAHVEKNGGFTVSAGISSLSEHKGIIDKSYDLLKIADLALEEAKNTGRNRQGDVNNHVLEEYAVFKLDNASKGKCVLTVGQKSELLEIVKNNIENLAEKIRRAENCFGCLDNQEEIAAMKDILAEAQKKYKKLLV